MELANLHEAVEKLYMDAKRQAESKHKENEQEYFLQLGVAMGTNYAMKLIEVMITEQE